MNEIENLFGYALEEKNITPTVSASDKILFSVESEFQDDPLKFSEEEKERLTEEEDLKNKIKALQEKLKKYKNVKNSRLIHVNEKRALKRKEIKMQIAECNLRLSDIEVERK